MEHAELEYRTKKGNYEGEILKEIINKLLKLKIDKTNFIIHEMQCKQEMYDDSKFILVSSNTSHSYKQKKEINKEQSAISSLI